MKIGPNHDGFEVILVDALGADGIAGAIGGRGDGVCAVGAGDVAGTGDVATAGEGELFVGSAQFCALLAGTWIKVTGRLSTGRR